MTADPDVHELLKKLHHELQHAHRLTERDRELFDHLAAHVQTIIDQPEAPPETVSARLEASAAEIAADHPALAALMSRAVLALNNMGI